MPFKKYLRQETVAEMLDISLRHLIYLRERKLIPWVRLGRSVRMDPDAVAAAVKNLTVEARSP